MSRLAHRYARTAVGFLGSLKPPGGVGLTLLVEALPREDGDA